MRSLFFNKVNRVYLHFLVLEVIPSEVAVYKWSLKYSANTGNRVPNIKNGDFNFTSKEFRQRLIPVNFGITL